MKFTRILSVAIVAMFAFAAFAVVAQNSESSDAADFSNAGYVSVKDMSQEDFATLQTISAEDFEDIYSIAEALFCGDMFETSNSDAVIKFDKISVETSESSQLSDMTCKKSESVKMIVTGLSMTFTMKKDVDLFDGGKTFDGAIEVMNYIGVKELKKGEVVTISSDKVEVSYMYFDESVYAAIPDTDKFIIVEKKTSQATYMSGAVDLEINNSKKVTFDPEISTAYTQSIDKKFEDPKYALSSFYTSDCEYTVDNSDYTVNVSADGKNYTLSNDSTVAYLGMVSGTNLDTIESSDHENLPKSKTVDFSDFFDKLPADYDAAKKVIEDKGGVCTDSIDDARSAAEDIYSDAKGSDGENSTFNWAIIIAIVVVLVIIAVLIAVKSGVFKK